MHTVYIFRTLEEHKGLCFPVAMTVDLSRFIAKSVCVGVCGRGKDSYLCSFLI